MHFFYVLLLETTLIFRLFFVHLHCIVFAVFFVFMATMLTTTGVARVLQRTAAPRSVEQGRSGRRGELLDHDRLSPATSAGAAGQDPWKDGPPRGKNNEEKEKKHIFTADIV